MENNPLVDETDSTAAPVDATSQQISPTDDTQNEPAQHVRDLAVLLFEHTQPMHDLNEDSRSALELAALHHDLPIPSTKKKPYKAAIELLQSRLPEGLPAETTSLAGAIIVVCQGKLKRKDIAKLGLSPQQQREVLTMAAIIRIAIGLDHSGSHQTTIRQLETARDGMWIVVDGPQAIADAEAAQHNAGLWEKIGYPKVRVLEPTEAAIQLMPFPEPTDSIGILPYDDLAEAGRKVMRFHFARMLQLEDATRLGEDIEALHRMRVATRRLRAAFEVFGEAFKRRALKPHLDGLRATGRALGAVRDLDVFMEKAHHYLESLPAEERKGLDPLFGDWQAQRESARAVMIAHFDSQEYATFKRKFNVFLNTPGAGARRLSKDQPAPRLVCELAPVLIYTRLAEVRAYHPFLDNAPIERFHALRIELKKLRYTVEYFQEVLGKRAAEVIENLKILQDHLGDLNDAQVATQLLSQFIDSWEGKQANLPVSERKNIEAVVNYLAYRHAERHQLMVTFRQVWKTSQGRSFRRRIAQAVSVL